MIKQDAKEIIESADIVDVINQHVPLVKAGANYKGICPFHDDQKKSLIVSPSKQVFKCFACGGPENKGGDVMHFLRGIGKTWNEALDELSNGNFSLEMQAEQRISKEKEKEWKYIPNPPQEKPIMNHYKFGDPSKYWAYHNENGEIISYVCRFDLKEGEKEVWPFSYATNGERSEWRWLGMERPRPLYNLHLIKSNPNATILVVEGEKTADAAQSQLNPKKTVVTTWIGGANGVKNADWTVLFGRKIIYFPDNDFKQTYGSKHEKAGELKPWHEQPGNSAMLEVYKHLKSDCEIQRWIPVDEELPNKWDCADREWKKGELKEYLKKRLKNVPIVELETEKEVEKEIEELPKFDVSDINKNPPLPKLDIVHQTDPTDNSYFRMLGYEKSESGGLVFYFFSHGAKAVIKFSPSSMNKSNLITLAPLNHWEEFFPKPKGIDIDAVQEFLIDASYKIGIFRDKMIRGRGAWIDEGKIIVHSGNRILKDGKYIPLRSFESKFVYEIGENLGFEFKKELTSKEGHKIIDKFNWLMWERPVNAYLIAGWCVIAPFCGVLNWRPHIWITGPAGSGKSHVLDRMIKPLMGDSAIVVQGKTTEPGIRGILQSDARPVLFDESDVDTQGDKDRVQAVVSTVRSSSYSEGGEVAKGTQTGTSRSFSLRSCFALSSIGVHLNQQSDRSRFSIFTLKSFERFKSDEEFAKFDLEWSEMVTPDFVKSLHTRTLSLLPVILTNIKTFSNAASHVIGNRRIGDQIGGMLAGAYSLSSRKEITYDDAVKWMNDRDWTEEKGMDQTTDENQLFAHIMGSMLKLEFDGRMVERTVGELIEFAKGGSVGADNRLRRAGIMIIKELIYFSNSAVGLKSILKNSPWSNNHGRILERLDGACKIAARKFYPGHTARCVTIPISRVISDGKLEELNKTEFSAETDQEIPF